MTTTTKPTKRAAREWLVDHVGQTLNIQELRGDVVVWQPEPRVLSGSGSVFRLNESRMSDLASSDVTIIDVTATRLVFDQLWGDVTRRWVYSVA